MQILGVVSGSAPSRHTVTLDEMDSTKASYHSQQLNVTDDRHTQGCNFIVSYE